MPSYPICRSVRNAGLQSSVVVLASIGRTDCVVAVGSTLEGKEDLLLSGLKIVLTDPNNKVPGFCLRWMAHDPSSLPKFLVPERMAHEPSYWYQFLVPETRAENLGGVPWALYSDVVSSITVGHSIIAVCHFAHLFIVEHTYKWSYL